MNDRNQILLFQQAEKKIQPFRSLLHIPVPAEGWVHTIRTALNMSLRQLGNKLNISAQGVKKLETNEKHGAVTIGTLQDLAKALDMKLVYGFVPIDGSLDNLVTAKAQEIAEQIVRRASVTMKLEGQENSEERLRAAIAEKTNELKAGMPKFLWE